MLKENLISQSICLIKNKEKHLKFLKDEVHYQRVEQQITCKILQQKIERFQEKLKTVERAYALNKNREECLLFRKKEMKEFRNKGYRFIHLNLIH
jgi:hypothetical protein